MAKKIGILAYGSLINEPGDELEQCIICIIPCTTPFKVEFARKSKTRKNAPTLIPYQTGAQVPAIILVLSDAVTITEAKNMLWRREARKSKEFKYKEPTVYNPKKIYVKQLENFEGVEYVLYTELAANIENLTAENLAQYAIQSRLSLGEMNNKDGITYLLNAKSNGLETPLSSQYETEILKLTETKSLEEAIAKVDAQLKSSKSIT